MDCANCHNVNECEIYCPKKKLNSLIQLINKANEYETKIGETVEDRGIADGKSFLVITGIQLNYGESITEILRPVSSYQGGKNEAKVDESWMVSKIEGIEDTTISSARQKIKQFNSYKVIVVPFKTMTMVQVTNYDELDSKGKIVGYTYKIDKDTKELIGSVIIDIGSKSISCKLSEYGSKWRVQKIDVGLSKDGIDYGLIEMTNAGLYKPMMICCGKSKVAIDNCYVHYVQGDNSTIIGTWDNDEIKFDDKCISKLVGGQKSQWKKIKNKISAVEKFICNHRTYIIPFGLCKAKEIVI